MLAHLQCKICDPSCTYESYSPPVTTFITEHEKLSYIWISVAIGILILPSIRPFNKKETKKKARVTNSVKITFSKKCTCTFK